MIATGNHFFIQIAGRFFPVTGELSSTVCTFTGVPQYLQNLFSFWYIIAAFNTFHTVDHPLVYAHNSTFDSLSFRTQSEDEKSQFNSSKTKTEESTILYFVSNSSSVSRSFPLKYGASG